MSALILVGSAATLASTISFVPQAWKIIRRKTTDDISAGTYVLTVGGFSLWTIYGVLLHQWPLIITNIICLTLSSFILMMKLLPRQRKAQVAELLDPNQPPNKANEQ